MRGAGHWVHMEIFEGSYGGRCGLDGMDAVDTLYANTRNNPIEDIETHLPLRVARYELREDACGAGEWRGGLGSIREFEYLADGGASVEADGHEFRPWAFAGGAAGRPAELRFIRRNGDAEALPSKVPHMRVLAGERFACVGPAGGGYGDPLRRDPARVHEDVVDGFISVDAARNDYGVVLIGPDAVDKAATALLRGAMVAKRGVGAS
jgi:N-methylhydantoinase B